MAKFKVVHTQRAVLLDYVQREYDQLLVMVETETISESGRARMRRLRDHLQHAGDKKYDFYAKLKAEGEIQ